jgi:hypothetical protein
MHACIRGFNAFQLRSIRLIEIVMGVAVATQIILQAILERHNVSIVTHYGMGVLAVFPVIAAMILIARYLSGEKDEYLRNLVVQSILWGFGLALIVDIFLSFVDHHPLPYLPIGNINMDVFILTSSITLEFKIWRNQ